MMNAPEDIDYDEVDVADSWSHSVTDDLKRSNRRAWMVAIIAALIALLEAIALVILMPLKTVEPYTLLVDRQTGNVEALDPFDEATIGPDAALTRSFLAQYVTARESFDVSSLQEDYRRVALWSAGEARSRYIDQMQPNAPGNPFSYLPRTATVSTEVVSVSSLSANRSMIRFQTTRRDRGSQPLAPQRWVAIIDYEFSGAAMSEEDRLLNPLGFQVTEYRRDAETLPDAGPAELPPVGAAPRRTDEPEGNASPQGDVQ